VQFVNGYAWPELVSQFRHGELDLLHAVILTRDNESWGLPGTSYASLPYALVTREGRLPLRDISELSGSTLAIPAGWSIIPVIRERFPDLTIVEVKGTLAALERVLSGDADAALDNEIIMRYIARHYFLEGLQYHSGISLGDGAVPDKLHVMVQAGQPRLRAIIDKAIAAIGPEQREYLSAAWLNFGSAAAVRTSSTVPSDMLVTIAGDPGLQERLLETNIGGKPYLVYAASSAAGDSDTPNASSPVFVGILAPLDSVLEPFISKVNLSIAITGAFLILLLPLSWVFASPIVRPIRQLATENDKVRMREFDKVVRVDSRVQEVDELSESMVNMVAAIQAHELAQRRLMDSFIQLIAQAIDDKSAYTGGHCERVPELALMLAEHASSSDLPAFREFRLESEDQWREFRIAAWLHDCGKITTPEHIVDKGSKLETIYNRIHEIRMRFEVLWRDAEIDFLKKLAATPQDEPVLTLQLEQRRRQLRDDYKFVAECNVGGEFLDQEKQDRLHTLARSTWQRFFDNRIGLSPVEELRLLPGESTLPATEHLLTDSPGHIIERTMPMDFPPEFGINMDIPEHLYNQGEIYNLSISRGTLTDEDRFKINEHVISTIKMLESLPFPDELKNVPRYASTHHETMKGSGYPRRLPGEQLSIPERILAVADIFEALTASDRPYKKAKPVSVAVDILHKMVLDNHIDRDCFELFIRNGVYLEYARRFLPADQIDAVDIGKYVH
jgi:HD-GYP domain-containing protein (c-di-GMP phosphodiesterase class II)